MSNENPTPPESRLRSFRDLPSAVAERGWRFHHVGIPTQFPRHGEHYLSAFKVYASGFDSSAYGVEWLRFEADSPVSEIIRTIPHVAFVVDNLEESLAGKQIILPPCSPYPGVRAAMFIENGSPIEVLEFA